MNKLLLKQNQKTNLILHYTGQDRRQVKKKRRKLQQSN